MPKVSMLGIAVIIMIITAAGRDSLLAIGAVLILLVLVHNLLGYLLGYSSAKLIGMDEASSRTIAFEVGMQNSGLATELARSNFSSFGLATVPGAISALTHCILGSIFAGASKVISYKDNVDETKSNL